MDFLLMQPYRLKNLPLRNRLVMAPMLSRLCYPDGVVSPQLIDYYAARAKGGVGLIIVEYCYIDQKESKANQGQLGVYSDQLIPGLADLTEAIQEWGAKVILQICHAGRSTSAKIMGRQPIAPSAMPSYTGEMAREMTLTEIEQIQDAFAEAARRAKTAGFDGVELHGTHGYLLAQFLSPYTNRRQDIYGQDRRLFALQTLEKVRSKVGNDYLIGYRLSAEEFVPGGITLEEAQRFACRLEEKGIDYIHVSAGLIENGEHFVIPMYFPKGYLLHLAEGIKQKVRVPVIGVGAVHDPYLAEEALQKGQADLIAMGRALLADPDLPNKIKNGCLAEIRPCLRCNEGCSSRVRQSKTQRCAVNAEVGRERQLRLHPAVRPKRVCVIGGGPAGLEAARVLAQRGHQVILIEKEEELGGLLRYASIPDFKAELRSLRQYLQKQIQKLSVGVLLSCAATPELISNLSPEAVVLATGSTMALPDIPGSNKPWVATALDFLAGKYKPGQRVLVAGGAAMGCELALHLSAQGKEVTLVEMLPHLAQDLELRSRQALLHLLKEGKVVIMAGWKLMRIEQGEVWLQGPNQEHKRWPTDSVILALGLTSNQELLKPLQEKISPIYIIGDCLQPRKIYQAIHEGAFVGRVI
ncbi:MAG: FAD-dependent oxidoreductase [Thermodesulfobacteriota bacterium]